MNGFGPLFFTHAIWEFLGELLGFGGWFVVDGSVYSRVIVGLYSGYCRDVATSDTECFRDCFPVLDGTGSPRLRRRAAEFGWCWLS